MTGLLDRMSNALLNVSHDRRVARGGWGQARSLRDLGELTARWLEGVIPEHPGYYGRPDEETGPITDTLARVNRAGYVTIQSQAAARYQGQSWEAWVEGVADPDTAEQLERAAAAEGLVATSGVPGRRRRETGLPWGYAGSVIPSRSDLAGEFDACAESVAQEACGAIFVAITDPVPGRNDRLWPLLDRFARRNR